MKVSVVWKAAAAALLVMALAGCFGKPAPQQEPPQQAQTQAPNGFTLPQLDGNPELITSYYLSDTDAWLFYIRKEGVETPELWGFFTADKGKNWTNSKLPTKRQWEHEVTKDQIIASLPSSQTGMSGWVALTAKPDPATGKIEKSLYQTDNHGAAWTFTTYLTNVVDGNMTGMTFVNNDVGWISANYTGNTFVPLYRTLNGGKSWQLQLLSVPNGYKYGNVQPPVFEPGNAKNGTVKVEYVGDNDKKTVVEWKTTDGGENWKR